MRPEALPRTHERTIVLVLARAIEELFPRSRLRVAHSYENGLYAEIDLGSALTARNLHRISRRIGEIVSAREPIARKVLPKDEALQFFRRRGARDKVRLIESMPRRTLPVHTCGRTVDHFPGPLFENTGLLTCFDLRPHPPGFLLRFPEDRDTPTLPTFREQPRLFEVFQEYEHWGHVLGLDDVGALNGLAAADEIDETIRVAEALHEKKVALIADRFVCCRPRVRVILISGPSASGKTTFSKRLAVQLRVNRLRTFTVSLDEYFYPRRGTPVAGGGLPNYEGLEALDVGLLNRHLRSLLAGRRVVLPHFDFRSGCRERGRTLELAPDSILILEGIHALDPALTPSVDHRAKFRIYVSALTHLNIDDLNRIPTSETRLLRRMVRDSLYRGYNAAETLRRWTSVHEGEKRFVFPFQEKADVMFNSALVFELAVLKHRAIPLLSRVRRGTPEHPQAAFLRSLLSYVRAVSDSDVPSNSILREFIGGSGFRY